MKTIQGVGGANEAGDLWLALVPDDATSCQDERRYKVVAPASGAALQTAWLEGFAAAIKHINWRLNVAKRPL